MSNVTEMQFDIGTVIPVGREKAVSRKYLESVTGMSDRQVRKCISESKLPIVNLGYGYFIPDNNDEIDVMEARAYFAQECSRIQTLKEKLDAKFQQYATA